MRRVHVVSCVDDNNKGRTIMGSIQLEAERNISSQKRIRLDWMMTDRQAKLGHGMDWMDEMDEMDEKDKKDDICS